jgi:hypothetical protein
MRHDKKRKYKFCRFYYCRVIKVTKCLTICKLKFLMSLNYYCRVVLPTYTESERDTHTLTPQDLPDARAAAAAASETPPPPRFS